MQRGKSRCKFWDLLADGRSSQAVLDFPATTDVERLISVRKTWGAQGAQGARGVQGSHGSHSFFSRLFILIPLARSILLGQAWAEGKSELATSHRVDDGREQVKMYAAIV